MLLYLTSLPIPNKIRLPTAPGECGIFYYSSSQTHTDTLVDGLFLFDSIFEERIFNLVDQLNLDYTFSASTGYLLSDVISFISEVVALQTGNAFFYDSVSLEDFVHLIAHYKESLQDAININHILQSLLIAITLDKSLNFNDYINEYIEFSLHSPLFLLSYGNASLKCSLSDMVDLSMLLDYRISSLFRDSVTVMDEVTAEASLFYSLIESLYFYDLLSFTSSALEKILALYIDLYYPQRFSFLDISAINCSDTIFALQDGLYTLDLSSTNSSMVALNFSELQSSRMKRIDKIYSNVPLYSATLYADDKKYFLSGNSKFISVPKGIRAKDYKLVIENTENVEFIDVALFEERRPK